MEARHVTLTEHDRRDFVGEIKYYLITVAVPLNLMFAVFFFIPEGRYLGLLVLLLDLFIYLTKVKPAIDDLKHDHFMAKQGVFRTVRFRLSFEKFEYRLDGDPAIYSSVTSRYRPFLEHAVEIVYAEKSHRIVRVRQI